MLERFGITVNRHVLREIKELIHKDGTAFVRKQSNRVSVHALTWEGQLIHVCYDKQRGELVTALLPEWEDEMHDDQTKDRIHQQFKEIEIVELLPETSDQLTQEAIEREYNKVDDLTGQGRR